LLRAAAPETAAEPAEEPVYALDVEDDEEQQERVQLDAEARAALRTAEMVMANFATETLLESEVAGEEERAALVSRAAAMVEGGLEGAKGALDSSIAAAAGNALAAAGVEPAELESVEDFTGAAGFRKYDEEEAASVSPEVREEITPLKLTRQELANLVPQDWSTLNVEWFSNKKEEKIPLPEYRLSFLWQEKNIAVAVDQVYSRGQTSPLTEFFFWPRKDAWEELKAAIEARPWVSER
jgi:30S ribosomal protein 3